MFPPSLPRALISWLTQPGDVVWDPFCGRGTVPFEACQIDRQGYGSDLNPLAVVLTRAKVDPPTREGVLRRLDDLRETYDEKDVYVSQAPSEIRMLFHTRTLRQLLWLRDQLKLNSRRDRFIVAVILGVMHANATRDGTPRGLSVAMPNTFAMSPGYIRRFIRDHHLRRPFVDVFDKVEARIQNTPWPVLPRRGSSWRRDALDSVPQAIVSNPPSLILTSPPYLDVISYAKYNWIRLWFLRTDWRELEKDLFSTGSPQRYRAFLSRMLTSFAQSLRPDGYLCLVLGDVIGRKQTESLADQIAATAAETGWRQLLAIEDRFPARRRVSRIWRDQRVRGVRIERIVVLSRTKRVTPRLGPVSWEVAAC